MVARATTLTYTTRRPLFTFSAPKPLQAKKRDYNRIDRDGGDDNCCRSSTSQTADGVDRSDIISPHKSPMFDKKTSIKSQIVAKMIT
jgi:hypothetical protein